MYIYKPIPAYANKSRKKNVTSWKQKWKVNPRKTRHWSTARRENDNNTKNKWVNAGIRGCGFGSSCVLAGTGAAVGEGQTDPVRLKSSSQSRTRQAVSEWPADSSVCLSEVSTSFLVSPPSAGWGRYYSPRKQVCFQISLFSADAD